jgi:hypothetical protein
VSDPGDVHKRRCVGANTRGMGRAHARDGVHSGHGWGQTPVLSVTDIVDGAARYALSIWAFCSVPE